MIRKGFITITILLTLLICTGCETDYDIDKYFEDFKPRVVLNSIISPDMPIVANLCWSKYYADTTDYKMVESFYVELYKNGSLIESLHCEDGLFASSFSPQETKTYSLKITVPNYGEINATTTIPTPVTSSVEYVKMAEVDPDNSGNPYRFSHFKITEISPVDVVRAVWIMTQVYYEAGGSSPSQNGGRSFYLYSDNEFTDKLNARQDLWCLEAKGSSIRYNQYMRIVYANFSQALPLDFSVEATGRFENKKLDEPDQAGPTDDIYVPTTPMFTVVNIITPSTDYDQYQESMFESYHIDPFGSGGSSVYSNVENGLGIFAGYSSMLYQIDIKDNQQ